MFSAYTGMLYQVKRADGTTKDIGAVSGYGDGATQDKFCAGSACTISIIYDQTGNGNDLTPAPAGSTKTTPDSPANASDLKVSLNGHSAYGIFIKKGMGYRKVHATKTATGDQPETEYMVTSQNSLGGGCCFDYGNAEQTGQGLGSGTMEAIYIGGGVTHWGTGTPGGHKNGPWVMADLENGLYAGWENNQDQDISTNTVVKFNFVTAVVVGDVASQNGGKGRFALYGGDATSPTLKTEYDGIRPAKPGYVPMTKQGGIVLGIGGDNSAGDSGLWYEGVMASGAATTDTLNKLQANIAAAGYGK